MNPDAKENGNNLYFNTLLKGSVLIFQMLKSHFKQQSLQLILQKWKEIEKELVLSRDFFH